MEARVNLIILICLSVSISVGFSQEAPTSEPAAAEVKTPSFPYVAEITADDVYCRSGPGTNYYPCGKFKKGDRVTVVGSQFSWSRIVPPAGSFSWISAQYVKVDPNRPIIGTVTGNAVRVYVGSDYVDLMRSTRPELKLNVGEKVKLMGEPNSGYYKIAPPGGGYRWVSTTYAKPVAPVSERPTAPPPRPVAREVVVPTRISGEAGNLKQYYALERQMRAERSRPIAQQDYRNIRRALLEIARNEQAGKAARYAKLGLEQIERFELAGEVDKTVRLQNAQLQRANENIERAKTKRLAEVQELGKYAVIGRVEPFEIYGSGHYRIIDESGKTLCYALPANQTAKVRLGRMTGRKVGLVGTIEPHLQTAGAAVRFTELVELW